jgi:hypothetical protein
MKRPSDHIFRGVPYKIFWRHPRGFRKKVGGACSCPRKPFPQIEVSPNLRGESKLRVIIDESIHACLWELDNDIVGEISTNIAHLLWECGLRFEEEEDED